jgi:hypothetical protein
VKESEARVRVRSLATGLRCLASRISALALLALALAPAACVPAVTHPAAQPQPDAPALGTPVSAVRSYLDWTAWSLRTGRAQDASPTMTADEFVRVDAYVEMQRQRGRRVDERLDRFVPGTASAGETATALPAHEEWTYRYVAASSTATTSLAYHASYETTYALVHTSAGWVVDRVEARALTPVP